MVGSKLDLEDLRTVPKEKGIEMAEKHGAIGWIECSAKDGTNVSRIFEELARGIVQFHSDEKKNKKITLF